MILVDSSVWIDYFRGIETREADWLDNVLDTKLVATGDLILTEVLQGFASEKEFNTARKLMSSLTLVELCGHDIALEAARNFRSLRAKGITVRKTIDTVIATYCIENSMPLLFSDRDFQPFVDHRGLQSALA